MKRFIWFIYLYIVKGYNESIDYVENSIMLFEYMWGSFFIYKKEFGVATLKDVKTGKKEILPSTAKDKNGKKLR